MGIFNILAGPIGWLLRVIFDFVNNYFVAIFLTTLVVRIVTFPLNLKTQKSTADRARLAPRLERIQKKYGQDRQKMAQKQQELYQKEGVSMTAGCLPSIVQIFILFSVLNVIYAPVSYLVDVPDEAITAAVEAVKLENFYQKDENGNVLKDANGNVLYLEGVDPSTKISEKKLTGYYRELNMLKALDTNREEILKRMNAMESINNEQAVEYYNSMVEIRGHFQVGNLSLLDNPWNDKGFGGINWLWLIVLFSGLTAAASSIISTRYMKGSAPEQPAQGCSPNFMMYMIPIFSLFTFTVPGAVGIYWISSNVIAIGQTVLLNAIYNPAKIRAQAEIEYQERRRQRAEDKKRLAELRAKEQAE